MTAMILKELKANLKWALLACAAWSACLFAFARVSAEPTLAYREMLSFPAQAVTVLLFPLMGFLLSLVQALPESRRDAWAFLVHRPLSRGRIFWSKAIAGLLLYFAAVLLPAVVFLIWLIRPGRLALPFEWRALLPASADLATGVIYYFAGLLVAVRQARWFGSRIWPLFAAVVVSLLVCRLGGWPGDSNRFLMTLWPFSRLILLAVASGLVLAAYGAFQSGGTSSRQPRLCRWGLALSLIVGGCLLLGTCWEVVAAFPAAMHFYGAAIKGVPSPEKQLMSWPLRITEDGSVLGVVCRISGSTSIEQGQYRWTAPTDTAAIVAVLDPSGQPIAEFDDYVGKPLADLPGREFNLRRLDWVYGVPRPEELPPGYRWEDAYLAPAWQDNDWQRQGKTEKMPWGKFLTSAWHYYPNQGRFFGCQRTVNPQPPWEETYAPLGSVGPDGFQPPSSPNGPGFPPCVGSFGSDWATGSNVLWITGRSDVWLIDFGEKKVQHVLSLPADDAIVATSNLRRAGAAFRWSPEALAALPDLRASWRWPTWWRTERGERDFPQEEFYVLTRSARLLFLSGSEGALADIPLEGIVGPTEMIDAGHIPGKDRFYIATRREFLELAKSGEVLARFSLPEQSPLERYRTAAETAFETRLSATVSTVVIQPTASVPALRLTNIAASWIQRALSPRLWRGELPVRQSPVSTVSTWERARPALASALVAFVLCYWWVRRRALPRGQRIAWLLAAVAFGPGVLLALSAFYGSPAKEPCPACGRKRLVTRERCEHCGAPFDAPAPTGIEIVETAE